MQTGCKFVFTLSVLMWIIFKIISISKKQKILITYIICSRIVLNFAEIMPGPGEYLTVCKKWWWYKFVKYEKKPLLSSYIFITIVLCTVAMATGMVRKNYFMMLWKGYQNFDFFHKIWKPYLEWYTSALGVENPNKSRSCTSSLGC